MRRTLPLLGRDVDAIRAMETMERSADDIVQASRRPQVNLRAERRICKQIGLLSGVRPPSVAHVMPDNSRFWELEDECGFIMPIINVNEYPDVSAY